MAGRGRLARHRRIDVGGESVPYIAGWGQGTALEAVIALGKRSTTVRQIEDALGATVDEPAPPAILCS